MNTTTPPRPFTLRDLPIPAKLVVSGFLIAIGLGYFSALVQLHLQHSSRNGEPMPSVGDVVEIFSGKKKVDPNAPPEKPASKMEKLIMGPIEGAPWNGNGSMAAAFFHKDGGGYRDANIEEKAKLDPERNGDRNAIVAWLNAPPADRKTAYDADAYPLSDEMKTKPLTDEYLTADKSGAKVKSILDARCARCHMKGGAQESYPLETYEQIAKYAVVPPAVVAVDGWMKSDRQTSVEKLTQSTHAHLLSFAMLFSLTGLTFAFTGYPLLVRCVVAPLVLFFQVADVSCWWLARIDGVGPYFAMAIIGTGGISGLGLLVQIVGSLWAMYEGRSRLILSLVLFVGVLAMATLIATVIMPALVAEKTIGKQPEVLAVSEAKSVAKKIIAQESASKKKVDAPKVLPVVVSHLEKLIMGPRKGQPWNGEGSMAAAFFEKDKAFKAAMVKGPNPQLEAEREGERLAMQTWLKLPEPERKKAYDTDVVALPPTRIGQPITANFLGADKKTAKVKSIFAARCVICHSKDGEQDSYPYDTYAEIAKYFGPAK